MTIKRKSGFNIITELICVLIIVVFYIKNINRLLMPSIIYDEIGYWASAAWWNGWDWSDIMSNFSSYYSYGYSTILFVLMQLFHNPEILHQSAIVFNIFMVVIGYIVILNFINWLFPNINTITKNILCMLPLFSPSVQYHTQVAWSETLLFFLFLISIISIKKMIQNKSIISFVIYAFLLIYMYITHQRTVGILISGILLSLIISFISKSWKQFIALMCTVSILLVCISIIKQQILINVYSNANGDISLYVNGNDYIGQITKIKHLFSLEGFYDFLISLFGKVYYFFLSSFFIGGYGIYFLFKSALQLIKDKKAETQNFISFYILGAYFSTLMVAAIFMIYPGRIDTVAYGRYTDFIGIIIIAIGLFYLFEIRIRTKIRILLGEIIFVLLFAISFQIYIKKYNVPFKFFASCSPIMTYFNNMNNKEFVVIMTLIIVSISIVLFNLTFIHYRRLGKYLFCIVSIFLWCRITYPSIEEMIRIQHYEYLSPVIEYLNLHPTSNIYYLYDKQINNASDADIGSVQYTLQERKINCITCISPICPITDFDILLTSANSSIPTGYIVEYENIFFRILQKEKFN